MFGDAIADVYSEYAFKKMCPDHPDVPAHVLTKRELRPGGAANVAVNLAMLSPGTQVDLIAVLDDDLARAVKVASQSRVNMDMCTPAGGIRKERVFLDGKLTARLDSASSYHPAAQNDLHIQLEMYLRRHKPDLVILSDYGAGCLTLDSLIRLPREVLMVDTKQQDLSEFDGCLAIKLNREELKQIMQTDPYPESHCKALVVTLGSDGAALHVSSPHPMKKNARITHTLSVPAIVPPGDVVDVCGCGDTFLAGMAASLLLNDDLYSAIQFGNAAAATVVTQPGTSVADRSKTLRMLGREET